MSKSAAGAKKYYSEEYYKEGHSMQHGYYTEKDATIGKWGGKAAEELGMVGNIRKEDFGDLCDNLIPGTGKKLTIRNEDGRRVGYDLTFNASKSVSIAYCFGNDEEKKRILEAFRSAVTDTMAELEKAMQTRVRGRGRNENRETGNIAYGEFIHFTTRPVDGIPDPHLHAHCFVFNATYDNVDKRWKAAQFGQIKQDAPYYEAYFHSLLADRLKKQGYGIERTKNNFELVGVDKSAIEKFSRRTEEIEEYAREHGITDDRKKSQVGAKTRESKRGDISVEEQLADWQQRLSDEERLRLQNLKNANSVFGNDNNKAAAAKEALQYSLDHHLERKSVASDKEILATAIKSSIGNTIPEQLQAEFEKKSDILSVKDRFRTLLTTKEALKEEKRLIDQVNATKGKFKPINEHYQPENDLLNSQQKKAVKHALGSPNGSILITGRAGVGKTTLMREVKKGINASGKTIFSFAPSSQASRVVQREEGFDHADTVASLIKDKERHKEFRNQVLWIDEAGMLSNKDMNRIMEIAKAQNARVILSGDTRQHSSVERGDALRVILKYCKLSSVTVDKIQRQQDAAYRDAVKYLSDGDVEKGFKKLDHIGSVKEIENRDGRVRAVAEDYYSSAFAGKKPKNVQVVAPTHAECEVVTGLIRQKLKEQHVISNSEKEFTVLRNLQLSRAEKSRVENYEQGQMLYFHQNVKGIRAGESLKITGVQEGCVSAIDDKGFERNVPVGLSGNYNVYEERKLQLSKGDRIRITNNGRTMEGVHIFNGTSYHVTGFDRQGNIKLSNGAVLPADFRHFTHGYVATSHSSQGKTADKVIISQPAQSFKAASMEQFYVSVSRGRQAVSIYTDDKEYLMQAVSRSSQRMSATELMAKKQEAAMEAGRVSAFAKMKQQAQLAYNHLRTINSRGR